MKSNNNTHIQKHLLPLTHSINSKKKKIEENLKHFSLALPNLLASFSFTSLAMVWDGFEYIS
jgi:hypothetical protein